MNSFKRLNSLLFLSYQTSSAWSPQTEIFLNNCCTILNLLPGKSTLSIFPTSITLFWIACYIPIYKLKNVQLHFFVQSVIFQELFGIQNCFGISICNKIGHSGPESRDHTFHNFGKELHSHHYQAFSFSELYMGVDENF